MHQYKTQQFCLASHGKEWFYSVLLSEKLKPLRAADFEGAKKRS